MLGLQRMFEKIGEESWKAFVPIYDVYVLSEHVWKPKLFVVYLILEVTRTLTYLIPIDTSTNADPLSVAIQVIRFFLLIVVFAIEFMLCINVSKAFGRKIGTAIGLLFLNIIFIPILGYGEAKYVGNPNAPKDTGEA